VTKVPERWSGSWEDNLALARLSDTVGVDFLLPIARWIGYGGQTNFHEGVLEPVTWAAGLLAATERIAVFATIHTAFNHPIVSAKQLATLDRIGGGRAGINVVAGWNKPEYDTFGIDLPTSHDDRYAYSQEWWEIVNRIWTSGEPFDHEGRFFRLEHVVGDPKPLEGMLPVLNAGASPQGRDFAARNANYLFTPFAEVDDGAQTVRQVTGDAAERYGRTMGVLTLSHVVCRPTRAEAEEYLAYYAGSHADWEAVDNLMRLQGLHAQSFSKEMLATFRGRFAAGHGSYPLIGDPDGKMMVGQFGLSIPDFLAGFDDTDLWPEECSRLMETLPGPLLVPATRRRGHRRDPGRDRPALTMKWAYWMSASGGGR